MNMIGTVLHVVVQMAGYPCLSSLGAGAMDRAAGKKLIINRHIMIDWFFGLYEVESHGHPEIKCNVLCIRGGAYT